jgi:hypothetical protein
VTVVEALPEGECLTTIDFPICESSSRDETAGLLVLLRKVLIVVVPDAVLFRTMLPCPSLNSYVVSDELAVIELASIRLPVALLSFRTGLALPLMVFPRKVLFWILFEPPSVGVSVPVKV